MSRKEKKGGSLVIAVKKTSRRDRPLIAHRFIGGTRGHATHRVPEGRSPLGKTGGERPSGTETPRRRAPRNEFLGYWRAVPPGRTDGVYTYFTGITKEPFLKTKETQESLEEPLLASIIREADPGITLDQVRATLRPIAGNLSDVIIVGREERL